MIDLAIALIVAVGITTTLVAVLPFLATILSAPKSSPSHADPRSIALGEQQERAAIVADLRRLAFQIGGQTALVYKALADRYEAGAHLGGEG